MFIRFDNNTPTLLCNECKIILERFLLKIPTMSTSDFIEGIATGFDYENTKYYCDKCQDILTRRKNVLGNAEG